MAAKITTTEAGKRLGVTRQRVVVMILAGQLPAEKFGRDWMIDPAALAAVRGRKVGRPKKGPK